MANRPGAVRNNVCRAGSVMSDEEYLKESHEIGCDCPTLLRENKGDPWDIGWLCTRPRGHTGPHVACGAVLVYRRWSTDYQPLPQLLLP